jgi:hypothetical protein
MREEKKYIPTLKSLYILLKSLYLPLLIGFTRATTSTKFITYVQVEVHGDLEIISLNHSRLANTT